MKFRDLSIMSSLVLVGLICVPTSLAQTTTYSYDALGRVIVVSHESADDRLYEYDDAGNRTDITVFEDGYTPNTPPICNSWAVSVSSGTTTTSINPIAGHCSDADGDLLTLISVTSPTNGASTYISGDFIVFSGLPEGTTSVSFTASDNNGGSDSAVLSVTRPFDEPMCGGVPC